MVELEDVEQYALTYLGAALALHWGELPRHVQEDLQQTALRVAGRKRGEHLVRQINEATRRKLKSN